MEKTKYFIGLDISADDFSASCITTPDNIIFSAQKFQNNLDGFSEFFAFLLSREIKPTETIVCMESTGVYCEGIAYFLYSKGFNVSIEAPHKVKQKIKDTPRKNDFIDSLAIAEYSYRYLDKLPIWRPQVEILQQLKTLLSTREHLVTQKTASESVLKTLKRKYIQTPLALEIYEENIKKFNEQIKQIDKEIKALIEKDDNFKIKIDLAMSVPGIGLLLATNLLVLTDGFTKHLNYKEIASYVGICPYEQISGRTLHKKPRSKRYGPSRLRKLLYLAALSVVTHNLNFRKYYLRKVEEGKSKRLVLNNIENKLLKIIFAVIKSGTKYIENYRSVNPIYLKKCLTMS